MAKYPIYLDLAGRKTLVIGAGSVASRKVLSLCQAGAKVLVVAKRIDETFEVTCKDLEIEVITGAYSKQHLKDAVLAIAATNDTELNTQIYNDCREMNVLCNVVDVPDLCDFYVPAVLQRGDLQIAIGTNGKSPAYAGHLKRNLEELFTRDHGRFLDELEIIRQYVIENVEPQMRKPILAELVNDESFELFLKKGAELWQKNAKKTIDLKS